jgi:hypothetical protein
MPALGTLRTGNETMKEKSEHAHSGESTAVESSQNESAAKPVEASPAVIPEIEIEAPLPQWQGISPKVLNLISVAVLVLCGLLIFLTFKDVDLSRGDSGRVTDLLATIIVRTVTSAVLLAWIVRRMTGKRKGYGFLTFSVVCTILVAYNAHYFRIGLHQAERKSQEDTRRQVTNAIEFASNASKVVQQGNTGAFPNIKPSGNANKDALLQPLNDFTKELVQVVGNMNQGIEALQERPVFETALLTNKSGLETEVRKRIRGQEIIEKCKQSVAPIIEATRQRYELVDAPEKDRRSALRGFEESIQKKASDREMFFRLSLQQQKVELDFLQFMARAYEDYRFQEEKISFGSRENSQKYQKLATSIETTENELEAFRKKQADSFNATKSQLQELGK